MSILKPALNELGTGIKESGSALYEGGVGVKDALVETFGSVKNRSEQAWGKSYGESLTEQFADNAMRIKANEEKIKAGGIFSKAYNSSKRALNQTLGRAYAGASGITIGSLKAVPQGIKLGALGAWDVAKGSIKAVGSGVGGLASATGELLTGTGNALKAGTNITRKPDDYNEVVDFKPNKEGIAKEVKKEGNELGSKTKPLNPSKEAAQQAQAA